MTKRPQENPRPGEKPKHLPPPPPPRKPTLDGFTPMFSPTIIPPDYRAAYTSLAVLVAEAHAYTVMGASKEAAPILERARKLIEEFELPICKFYSPDATFADDETSPGP